MYINNMVGLQDKIQLYTQLLANKKSSLDYVYANIDESKRDEEIEKINMFYDAELKKEYVDISSFISALKEKLDSLTTITEDFIGSIKLNPDPFTDPDVNAFINKCVMLRCYIDESFGKQIEDTIPKIDVINMMHSIKLENKYIDLLERYYPEHVSSMDIINMYKER